MLADYVRYGPFLATQNPNVFGQLQSALSALEWPLFPETRIPKIWFDDVLIMTIVYIRIYLIVMFDPFIDRWFLCKEFCRTP